MPVFLIEADIGGLYVHVHYVELMQSSQVALQTHELLPPVLELVGALEGHSFLHGELDALAEDDEVEPAELAQARTDAEGSRNLEDAVLL